jgi:homoserine kinase
MMPPGFARHSTRCSPEPTRPPAPIRWAARSSGGEPLTARRRLVRVPASSANLGPGYDVLAAALSRELELEVTEAGEFSVDAGDDVPADRSNLCVRAFEHLHPADGLRFEIRSQIPLARGLGSSAAAIVAGLVAADHLYELALEPAEIYRHAVELEGHPDNVAAALRGGFVVCSDDEIERFDPPPGLEAVVAVPPDRVPTDEARAVLPDQVPLEDAVHNVAHASLLMMGIARDDFSLIGRGLADRLHQQRRAHLYPRSMELLERAEELGAVGATISGAGPTVLFWCTWQQTGNLVKRLRSEAPDCDVRRVQFAPYGADVKAL